jgi:hypothetical protein
LIEQRGCQIVYLPSYSPDPNPIEEACSKIEGLVRKAEAKTREALIDAIGSALTAVTSRDARGFFKHCGYRMPGGGLGARERARLPRRATAPQEGRGTGSRAARRERLKPCQPAVSRIGGGVTGKVTAQPGRGGAVAGRILGSRPEASQTSS